MKVELMGKQVLLDENNNRWGFLVKENNKESLIANKYVSSAIPQAIDEILTYIDNESNFDNNNIKITLEILD